MENNGLSFISSKYQFKENLLASFFHLVTEYPKRVIIPFIFQYHTTSLISGTQVPWGYLNDPVQPLLESITESPWTSIGPGLIPDSSVY